MGDSNQKRSAVSTSGQDLAPSSWDLEAMGAADQERSAVTFGLAADIQEFIQFIELA